MNLITHLPHVSASCDSICTVVDHLLKYKYFVPCAATISTERLFQLFLHTIMARHGMPHRIITNYDSRFTSLTLSSFGDLCS